MSESVFRLWPKQLEALHTPGNDCLYGGSAGPGKSHLMRIAFIYWAVSTAGLQLYLFRRHYRDLIQGHMEGPTGFRALLAEMEQCGKCKIIELEIKFSNGSRISLNHCQHEKDVTNYKSIEFHVLGIEEASEFTEFQIRYLRSRCRMPNAIKVPKALTGAFPRMLMTSNPGGPGHAYLKKWFVDAAPHNKVWEAPESEGGMRRVYIPAKLTDNPSVNPEEYRKKLQGLGSPQLVEALLNGDWNAIVGAMFQEFTYEVHTMPEFEPAPHLFKFRVFDWGSYRPFAVGWYCVSDGNPIHLSNGKSRRVPRGSIIQYREWYGMQPLEPNVGLGMRNEDIAEGILQRTAEKGIYSTLTDSLPFQDRGGKKIADTFRDCGVILTQGDTSRVPGWSQLRSRLIGGEEGPTLYFVESCVHTIRTLPMLIRSVKKPEDIEDNQEDHAPDIVRLACMARPMTADAPKEDPKHVIGPTERTFASMMEKHIQKRARESNAY